MTFISIILSLIERHFEKKMSLIEGFLLYLRQ